MKLSNSDAPDSFPLSRADRELARPAGRVCPTCQVELPATGQCDDCD